MIVRIFRRKLKHQNYNWIKSDKSWQKSINFTNLKRITQSKIRWKFRKLEDFFNHSLSKWNLNKSNLKEKKSLNWFIETHPNLSFTKLNRNHRKIMMDFPYLVYLQKFATSCPWSCAYGRAIWNGNGSGPTRNGTDAFAADDTWLRPFSATRWPGWIPAGIKFIFKLA